MSNKKKGRNYSGIERRRFHRVELEKGVNYRLLDSNRIGNCMTKDISEGGIKLLSFEFIPKDRSMLIELQLEDEVIRTIGSVVWTKKFPYSGRYQIGIKFSSPESDITEELLEPPSEIRKTISDYVNNRLS